MAVFIFYTVWGYVGLNVEGGPIRYSYGEFLRVTIGYKNFGIGTTVGEAFCDGNEIDASLLPINIDYLLWKKDFFYKKRVFFVDFLLLRVNLSPWGTRWKGRWIFGDYYYRGNFIADIDYASLSIIFYKKIGWAFYLKSDAGIHFSKDRIKPYIKLGTGINMAGFMKKENLKNSLKVINIVQNKPVDQENDVVLEMIVENIGNKDIENITVTCNFYDRFKYFFEAETVVVNRIPKKEIKRIDINVFRKGRFFPTQDIPVKVILKGGNEDVVIKKVFLKSS